MIRLRVVRSRSIGIMVRSGVDRVDGSVMGSRVDGGMVGSGMDKGSRVSYMVGSGMNGVDRVDRSMVGKGMDRGVVDKGGVVWGSVMGEVVDTIGHSHANKGQDAECLSLEIFIKVLFKYRGLKLYLHNLLMCFGVGALKATEFW